MYIEKGQHEISQDNLHETLVKKQDDEPIKYKKTFKTSKKCPVNNKSVLHNDCNGYKNNQAPCKFVNE